MCLNRNPSDLFGRRREEERHLLCEFCCAKGSLCNRNLDCGQTSEYLVLHFYCVNTKATFQQNTNIRSSLTDTWTYKGLEFTEKFIKLYDHACINRFITKNTLVNTYHFLTGFKRIPCLFI